MTNKIEISIPQELEDKIKKKINETNFESISDYITYLLEQVVSEKETDSDKEDEQAYSKEDEEKIKKSLKDMGYI